jgi:hypothetical protein
MTQGERDHLVALKKAKKKLITQGEAEATATAVEAARGLRPWCKLCVWGRLIGDKSSSLTS